MTSRRRLTTGLIAVLASAPFTCAQFKSDVRLVEIYASVFDRQGNAVDGLSRDRFRILDNGEPRPVYSFEATSEDLTVAILLDTTGSMRDALASVRNAVSALIGQMRPGDKVGVFGFNTSVTVLQDFTTDKDAARRAVQRTRAAGGTALFDALAEVTRDLAAHQGKKVIVLFTDGADNASRLLPQAITDASLKAGIPVYSVAEGDATHEGRLLQQLKVLSEKTGGVCYRARTAGEVSKIFTEIQSVLSHVYLLSFRPPEADQTKWRTIQVEVTGLTGQKVRGKQGYFPN